MGRKKRTAIRTTGLVLSIYILQFLPKKINSKSITDLTNLELPDL